MRIEYPKDIITTPNNLSVSPDLNTIWSVPYARTSFPPKSWINMLVKSRPRNSLIVLINVDEYFQGTYYYFHVKIVIVWVLPETRVFRLWKLHGVMDWMQLEQGICPFFCHTYDYFSNLNAPKALLIFEKSSIVA